jgi:hypothetical protein
MRAFEADMKPRGEMTTVDVRNRPAVLALALLACLAGSSAIGAAADKVSAQKRAAVLQAIVDCRAVSDPNARLACFDAAAAKLDEAEASGQVVVVDKEQARQVRREVFGLQLPSLDIFSRASKGPPGAAHEDIDRIIETVKSASQQPDGKWIVELESGAVWRQIDTTVLAKDPHAGSKAEIRRGAIGSFFMKIDGQQAIRAHRDR